MSKIGYLIGNNIEHIVEVINNKDTAIVLFKSKDLKDFKNKSGELAYTCEFQCHYTALVRTEVFEDKSKQHLIFPLIYYNYPQEVSGAAISFDMKEVSKIGENVYETSINIYKLLKNKLIDSGIDNGKEDRVSYKMTMFNTIHKHP